MEPFFVGEAVEPGYGSFGLFLQGRIRPVGRNHRFEQAPEVFAGIEFRRAKGEPDHLDLGSLSGFQHALGMMGRRVVPDEQLGSLWPHLAQRLHECLAIIGAAALADHAHQFPSLDIERSVQHPSPIAPTDENHLLLPPFGPGAAQRGKLAQRRLIPDPDLLPLG